MEKDITIFICEDDEVTKEIIKRYFNKDFVTYCNRVSAEKRPQIIKKIEEVE